ncbi:hypothetical protein, partial [uncultured Actinomyces sp.]|uniref:hypothetical protein n=1 Tax=uncultured Actinomyces sp. TaxID=249061 RepID=UPI002628C1FA
CKQGCSTTDQTASQGASQNACGKSSPRIPPGKRQEAYLMQSREGWSFGYSVTKEISPLKNQLPEMTYKPKLEKPRTLILV